MEKKYKIVGIVIAIIIIALPLLASYYTNFALNQFFIQEKILTHNTISNEIFFDYIISRYCFGLDNLANNEKTADFADPKSMFAYVFGKIPSYAVVYPTETYYYYSFKMPDGKSVSGNLRLLDADKGVIHIGYFDSDNPFDAYAATFDDTDGIIVEKNNSVAKVTFDGKTVQFKLSELWNKPPTQIKLAENEEFVAHIQDESSIRFFLVYNKETTSFYYLLDDENGIEDRLVTLDGNYYGAKESNFVFFADLPNDRMILVGVFKPNIYQNNYYDGPFDQVPPRLDIKEKILSVYPYTAYGGGIDEHGNFLSSEGTRVAISPYYDYDTLDDLVDYQSRCDKSDNSQLISCITYEWKKDFHRQLENNATDIHYIFVSQGWPANHYGDNSMAWPAGHMREQSMAWPPNHDSEQSRK